MDDDVEPVGVVISNGSGSCKVGLTGEEAPCITVPAFVGKPYKQFAAALCTDAKDSYVGHEVQCCQEPLFFDYPIQNGIVTNWDDMEKIWRYTYRHLGTDPSDLPMLVTDSPMPQRGTREMMTQVAFESMNVPFFFAVNQAKVAFYTAGRTSGMILHCGDGVTHAVPIWEGYMVPEAVQTGYVAGRDLTDYMARQLSERGYSFSTSAEREIVRKIKEQHCYAALDFEEEKLKCTGLNRSYTLPNGDDVIVGKERFYTAEALFQPSLIGSDSRGLHQLAYDCLMACDIDMRRDLCVNFILSGGSTLCPGVKERLQKELKALLPSKVQVVARALEERHFYPWIGGSILSSLQMFQPFWISKQEYEEYGPCIIHQKCY